METLTAAKERTVPLDAISLHAIRTDVPLYHGGTCDSPDCEPMVAHTRPICCIFFHQYSQVRIVSNGIWQPDVGDHYYSPKCR